MGTIIEKRGSELFLNVDGTRLLMYRAGPNMWVNATEGNLKIRQHGSMMFIFTGATKIKAVKATPFTWIVTAGTIDPDPDPDPGVSLYTWPYEPTWLHWVTSEFGPRNGRFHEGIDFSGGPAAHGQPIPAIGAGIVTQSGPNGAFGNSIIIRHGTWHGYDWYSLYAHMVAPSSFGVGDSVDKADNIGLVNNTGSSFGSHLHMEIHRVPAGGNMRWDNLNPSYNSPRTAINPRSFFNSYGDNGWIYS